VDCCQPDATVGEAWNACLFLFPPKPCWASEGDQWSDEPGLGVGRQLTAAQAIIPSYLLIFRVASPALHC